MGFSRDIDDADTWITKALLLGFVLKQHQKEINEHAWRWSCLNPAGQVCSYSDWPGRAAQMEIERTIFGES